MDDASVRRLLLPRLAERRAAIQRWLRRSRARSNRLGVIGVVAGAIGAAATAGPGLGGTSFTDTVGAGLGFSQYSVVWQGLCLLGMVVSVVSAVTAGLLRHYDLASRVGAAEAAVVELDNVHTLLEFERIPVADAVTRYQQALATVSFVDDTADDSLASPGGPTPPSAGPFPAGRPPRAAPPAPPGHPNAVGPGGPPRAGPAAPPGPRRVPGTPPPGPR